MEKDKDIEALFLAQKSHFDDSAEFMAKLTKRLEAVEFIRQYQERTIRRYRIVMVAAFVAGIICGGISIVWLQSSSIETSSVNLQTPMAFLFWLVKNSRVFACVSLSVLMIFSTIALVNNILDIMDMRLKMREKRI